MSEAELDGEIEAVLGQDPDQILARQEDEFDRLLSSAGGHLVLFGAGRLGRRALAGLRTAGIEPAAFADNSPRTWTQAVDGVAVLPPDEAVRRFRGRALFVVTVYTSGPVRRQLAGMGVPFVSFASLAVRYPAAFLPHGALDLPHVLFREAPGVRRAASIWADRASRQEYLGQVRFRTTLDADALPAHLPPQEIYFPRDIVELTPDEFFVDCGAFDGDTVRSFLKRQHSFSGRVVALEPDPSTFERLQAFIRELPVGIRNSVEARAFAVGDEHRRVMFDATGTAASSVGAGATEVLCAPIDEILAGECPSYIKMDVEGAEMDALRGARHTLEKHSPVLAICLYHRPEDLWRIPLFLEALQVGYRLFLRRYADECWEQVCYAVPKVRLAAAP